MKLLLLVSICLVIKNIYKKTFIKLINNHIKFIRLKLIKINNKNK